MAFWNLLVAPLASLGTAIVEGRNKSAARKDRLQEAKLEGKIADIARKTKGAVDYDVEAQRQMRYSWKDEYLTVLMSLPFISSFIPVLQDSVQAGWGYVGAAPIWYQVAFGGIITATFGLRGYKQVKGK